MFDVLYRRLADQLTATGGFPPTPVQQGILRLDWAGRLSSCLSSVGLMVKLALLIGHHGGRPSVLAWRLKRSTLGPTTSADIVEK